MNAGRLEAMGNDAIQKLTWKIPADAQYVKLSPDSHTLVVYFYDSNNSYLGRTEFVTTETIAGISQGAAYAAVSLQACSPAQMAEDNYQVSFLDSSYGIPSFYKDYASLSSLNTALGTPTVQHYSAGVYSGSFGEGWCIHFPNNVDIYIDADNRQVVFLGDFPTMYINVNAS